MGPKRLLFLFCAVLVFLFSAVLLQGAAACTLSTVDPSVTICSPTNGSTVTSPVQVVAGTTDSAGVNGIIVYVDGVNSYRVYAGSVNTYLNIAPGTHSLQVKVWDKAGRIFSNTISITVSSGATCQLNTTNPSVTICSPANGATVSSPVHVVAGTTDSFGITGMIVYVDGTVAYKVYTSSVDTNLTIAAGTHQLMVKAWDTDKRIFWQTINITVGSGSGGVSVTVSPTSASVAEGATQQFTATVSGASNTAVTWSVDSVAGGNTTVGTVSSAGLYTAPSATGSHTVTATSAADSTKSASATVQVTTAGAITVTVSPKSAAVLVNQTQQFTANVTGTSNTSVTWEVDQVAGGNSTVGTITSSGVYSAPGTTGTHQIEAVSTADNTTTGTATVSVTNFSGFFTNHYGNDRLGQNTHETVLTPANVNVSKFGKRFTYATDGYAYAQPLYVANVNIPGKGTFNVVYVATEHDSVYAFDADGSTTSPLWHRSLLGTGVTSVPHSGDLGPEVGITSTPAIDPVSGMMYVVAGTYENNTTWVYRIHALDITTGADRITPKVISATVAGTGAGSVNGQIVFTPSLQMQRPGLLLLNGVLYLGFGSFGDNGNYHGWIMAYNASTLAQEAVKNLSPTGSRASLWSAGGGIAADSSGNIFFETGNGTFDNTGKDLGDSFVKMDGSLNLLDYFAPYNEAALNSGDLDMGSSGVILLPDQSGTSHVHIMIGSNKSGDIYVVDRDSLGHFNSSNNNNIVQYIAHGTGANSSGEEFFGSPAYWNGNVYFAGCVDKLRQFSLNNGLLSGSPIATSPTVITNFRAATPTVSSNGSSNGIVWVVSTTGGNTGTAVLHAYQATNVGVELYNSTQAASSRDAAGVISKFNAAAVANGRVYVAGYKAVWVYGLLQ